METDRFPSDWKRVVILGRPVGHSLGPAMQNAAFRAAGLKWFYSAVEVTPDCFAPRVAELPGQGVVGANVTIPHKLAALEVCTTVTPTARAVGAANTLLFKDGEVLGFNTDGEGFVRALAAGGISDLDGRAALVLGAGGAGRAVVWAMLKAGADPVYVWNRSPEKARRLIGDLGRLAESDALRPIDMPASVRGGVDVVVNTTSVGMAGEDVESSLGDLSLSKADMVEAGAFADVVYRPGGTALTKMARTRNLVTVDGFEMLIQQGARGFEIWTGQRAPVDAMRAAVEQRARG